MHQNSETRLLSIRRSRQPRPVPHIEPGRQRAYRCNNHPYVLDIGSLVNKFLVFFGLQTNPTNNSIVFSHIPPNEGGGVGTRAGHTPVTWQAHVTIRSLKTVKRKASTRVSLVPWFLGPLVPWSLGPCSCLYCRSSTSVAPIPPSFCGASSIPATCGCFLRNSLTPRRRIPAPCP